MNPLLDAQKTWRRWRKENRDADAGYRVGVAATFTADPLIPYVGAGLLEQGLMPAIELADYNQVLALCYSPDSYFSDETDAIVLLWRVEDLAEEALDTLVRAEDEAYAALLAQVDMLLDAIVHLSNRFQGTLCLNLPPCPDHPAWDLAAVGRSAASSLHQEICRHVQERLREHGNIRLLDLDALERSLGAERARDPAKWYLYRQPYVEEFHFELAGLLARTLIRETRPPKKCIVVDCDNTLWGGVIGEDGLGGIQLGRDFPGSVFRDFQRQLLAWRAQGVFLAVSSKNNEADAWQVFDEHDEMLLRREHLSSYQVNWDPKYLAIQQIAADLNIGTDSVVFVDDNPFEIEQMRSMLPEVTCFQVPEDLATFPKRLREARWFEQSTITEEDRQRVFMVAADKSREQLRSTGSEAAYLEALELEVSVFAAMPSHLARVHQLINKTNQFNLSTRRKTLEEVTALSQAEDWLVLCMNAQDRFGKYGLTGVCLVRIDDDVGEIETLLMSCRVLGRGIETAFLSGIASLAADRGVTRLEGDFLETPKNVPAADFYPRHSFSQQTDTRWTSAIAGLPGTPGYIRLALTERPETA